MNKRQDQGREGEQVGEDISTRDGNQGPPSNREK